MDYELKIYDQLLQFPLFQGMSRTELLQMAGNTRFDFRKLPARTLVVREGDMCTGLLFLIKGELELVNQCDDHSYRVVERLSDPWLLQPEVLYGLTTRYTSDVRTVSDCRFILLSKDEVLRLSDDFLTFRLNLLNYLSTLSQQRAHRPWRRAPQSLRSRVIRFFADHCSYPAGRKEFLILMDQLALQVNDKRLNVSRVLNDLQQNGLLELHRGRIVIPSLEHLFMSM